MTFKRVLIVAAVAGLSLVACDRSEPTPGQSEQVERNDEGEVWRSLVMKLENAPSDADRIALLERFIAEHPDHPDFSEAKRRLGAIQSATPMKELETTAWAGDPAALFSFFVLSQSPSFRNQAKVPIEPPVELGTLTGPESFDQAALLTPTRLRGSVRYLLSQHHPDGLDKPCREQCLNDALNTLLQSAVKGPLFEEPGKINKDVLGAVIEKGWIAPDKEIAGTAAAKFYQFYQPTVHAFVKVRAAAKEAGIEAAAEKLNTLSEKKEISNFYESWTAENGIAAKAGIEDEKTARNITSWWIRREADGSAQVLDDFFARLLKDYDPSFAAP